MSKIFYEPEGAKGCSPSESRKTIFVRAVAKFFDQQPADKMK